MDGGWFVGGIVGLLFLAALANAWNQSVRRAEALRAAADALGLRARQGLVLVRRIHGAVGGYDLSIRRGTERGDKRDVLRFEVNAPSISRIEICGPTVASMFRRVLGGATVETGDQGFDHHVVVRGYEVEALALLDEETRDLVRKAVRELRFEMRGGRLSIVTPGNLDSSMIVAHAQLLLHIASKLETANPMDALAVAVQSEPNHDVRRRCLEVYLRRATAGPRRDEVLSSLLADADLRLRLRAAKALASPAAVGVLRELAVEATLTPEARAEALEAALRLAPEAEAPALVDDAIAQREPALLAAALRAAAAGRVRLDANWMIRHIAHADDGVVALACGAVAASGDPHAESWLLARLRYGGDVRHAAIRALCEIGTVAAVPPLRELGGADSDTAIARIQARIEGGGAGQLTIAESRGAGGAVSLTDRDSGSLSIVTKRKQTT